MLKSLTIIVNLSSSPFHPINFYFTGFAVLLLSAYAMILFGVNSAF